MVPDAEEASPSTHGHRRSLDARDDLEAALAEAKANLGTECVPPPYTSEKCATEVYLAAQVAAAKAGTSEANISNRNDPCNCLPECVSTAYEMRVSSTQFPSDTSDEVHDHAVSMCRREMHEQLTGLFSDVKDEYGHPKGCTGVCKKKNCFNVHMMYEDVHDSRQCSLITMKDILQLVVDLETLIAEDILTPKSYSSLPLRYQEYPDYLPGQDPEQHGKANEYNEDVWCPPLATKVEECEPETEGAMSMEVRVRLRQKWISQKRALLQLVEDAKGIDFNLFGVPSTLGSFIRGTCGAASVDWDLQTWKSSAPRGRFVNQAVSDARQTAVSISIYYGSPDEEVSTVGKKMTTMDFFGGVGGMFGLICGMSVLTMFEMLEFVTSMFLAFFFPWVWMPCCKKREGRKQHDWAAKNATNRECLMVGGACVLWFLGMFIFLKLTLDFDPDSIEPPIIG